MSSRPLGMREISLFFFPLLLNIQLMSISHSIINGALARLDDFVTALASFSVAMVLHLFVASPSYQNHTVTIAMVRGRQSLIGTAVFVVLVACYVSVALALMAFTPVGTFLLETVLGVNQDIARGAREVLSILALLPFFTGFRGFFQGLVIRARRTSLVSFATGVRVAVLFLLLATGTPWFKGPALGAFALLGCIMVETALVAFFAWRCHLPASGEEEKTTGQILRYAFPLAYSSCLQQTIPLLINAIIGRLADGELALAAFGVIRGFIFLLAGPMRNLQQAYLTLVTNRADYRVLIRFFLWVGCGMGLLMFLTAFPLNHWILGRIMGIETGLRHYIAWPMAGCTIFPLLYGAANLLRGFFAGAHLGRSTLFKSLFLAGCWGLSLLLPLPVPGIALAVALLLSAETLEAWYLLRQRRRLYPEWGRLPNPE
ncbi:MAG: MATE family efflux transporter [Desulfuromonadaceae bacterium]